MPTRRGKAKAGAAVVKCNRRRRLRAFLLLAACFFCAVALRSTGKARSAVGIEEAPACRIPRIIHQTWKSENVDASFAPYMRSWVRKNPGWEYWFWTDEAAAEMMKEHYPKYWPMYKGYATPIQRADAIRYFLLHKYGGVYADLDFEALRAMDTMSCEHSAIIGQEPFEHSHVLYDIPRMLCNALMASAPAHLLWLTVHDELYQRRVVQKIKTVRATGPRMLSYAVERYENSTREAFGAPATEPRGAASARGAWSTPAAQQVFVPPPTAFYPLFDSANTVLREKCGKPKLSARQQETCASLRKAHFQNKPVNASVSLAVHHWAHTWLGHRYEMRKMNAREAVGDNRTMRALHAEDKKKKRKHRRKVSAECVAPGSTRAGEVVHALRCVALPEETLADR